jgi:hypothetical protein
MQLPGIMHADSNDFVLLSGGQLMTRKIIHDGTVHV